MEREIVLANLRGTLDYSAATREWLAAYATDEWFARDDTFLFEFASTWRDLFVSTTQEVVDGYFASHGLTDDLRPFVRVGEYFHGSFIVDGYLVLATGIPAAYALLKGVAELPKLADDLEKLKGRVCEEFEARSNAVAFDRLRDAFQHANERRNKMRPPASASRTTPEPPASPLRGSFTIDARPLRALKPEEPVSHRVQLSVSATHESLVIENLGDEPMRAIRIGLFANASEQYSWSFADAYTSSVNLLSARQTLSKDLISFRDHSGYSFAVKHDQAYHVDCWIQDEHGIYLFHFVLQT